MLYEISAFLFFFIFFFWRGGGGGGVQGEASEAFESPVRALHSISFPKIRLPRPPNISLSNGPSFIADQILIFRVQCQLYSGEISQLSITFIPISRFNSLYEARGKDTRRPNLLYCKRHALSF